MIDIPLMEAPPLPWAGDETLQDDAAFAYLHARMGV